MSEHPEYELRYYHENVNLGGQIIKENQLKNVKYLAEPFFIVYRRNPINIQIKPIKNTNIDLDFQNNNNLLLEV